MSIAASPRRVVGSLSAEDRNEGRLLRRIYWASFAARCSIGLVGWFVTAFQLVNISLLEDALFYEDMGAGVADDWLAGRSSPWLTDAIEHSRSGWGMVVVIAAFYFLTGGLRLLPLLIVGHSALTAWTPIWTYRIGRKLHASSSAAAFGAWLVALSPAFAFWSGALYKEGLLLLVLSVVVYHALTLQETGRLRSLVIIVLSLPVLFALRFYLAGLVTIVLFLGLLLARNRPSSDDRAGLGFLRQFLVVSIIGALLFAIGFTDRIAQIAPEDLGDGLARIEGSRKDMSNQPSGYLGHENISTPLEALAFLPKGLVYFLASPFPWQYSTDMEHLRQTLAIPETLAWVCMYPLVLIGLRQAWRRNKPGALLLVLLTGAICGFYAIFCGNIGTAYRMRIQVWVLWAPLIGMGWEAWRGAPAVPASSR
jgi:hypothetical protein